MSSNREDIQLVLDNRVNVSKTTHALVKVSGNNVNYFEVLSDSAGPYNGIINFNSIITPSLASTVISRNPRIRYTVQITVDETQGVAFPAPSYYPVFPNNVLNSAVVANTVLRAFPLQSITSTLSLTINGATTTLNSRMMLDWIQRRLDKHWVMNQATECPCQPDNLAGLVADGNQTPALASGAGSLVSLTVTGAGAITDVNGVAVAAGTYTASVAESNFNQLSHANQVLSRYENSLGANRASFKPISITPTYEVTAVGTSNARVIVFEISEPLIISPFTTYDNETFLANINTMSMVFNLQNNKDMLVSALSNLVLPAPTGTGYNPACITDANFKISDARLEWEYIQVPQDLVTIPPVVSYPYENLIYFNKQFSAVNGGNNMSGINSDTIRFSAQPDLIAIYARQTLNNRDASTPQRTAITDTFFGIGQWSSGSSLAGVSFNYGVKSGLLASASAKTLFRISKRNGWKGSWNDWCNGQAVLLLSPTLDLGLDLQAGDCLPGEAAANQNFQCNMVFNDQPFQYAGCSQAQYALELMVCPVYRGVINITPNSALFNLGELSHSEVHQALQTQPKDGRMISDEVVKPTVQGGSLFGTLKSLVGTTANALKSDLGQKALGYVASMAGKGYRK